MKSAAQEGRQDDLARDEPRLDKTLVIGDIARWTSQGRAPVSSKSVTFTEFADLTKQVLDDVDPDLVLSPLVADDFDVVDVADRLHELGFHGQYRAITINIPNAAMIKAEVYNHAPRIDFDLLMMPPVANDG